MSTYVYPVLLSLHIVALIALGGMVVVTDLRLLGIGMRSFSGPDLMKALRIPKRVCFAVAAVCGLLMFGAKSGFYNFNPRFWIKMVLLLLIAANYFLIRRTPERAKLAAGISLVLGIGVVWAARGPATIKDVMHSMVDPSADFLFQSVQTIVDEHGIREISPKTPQEWDELKQRLLVLSQAPDLLPGRMPARARDRSNNPEVESEPEEIQHLIDADRPGLLRRAQRLRTAADVGMKAVEARDKDALVLALDGIDKACESCHLHYWYPRDTRAQEAAKADGIID